MIFSLESAAVVRAVQRINSSSRTEIASEARRIARNSKPLEPLGPWLAVLDNLCVLGYIQQDPGTWKFVTTSKCSEFENLFKAMAEVGLNIEQRP
jgi:hypothetical protein